MAHHSTANFSAVVAHNVWDQGITSDRQILILFLWLVGACRHQGKPRR